MVHELKTESGPYDAIAAGTKTFEFRRNDRDYRVGDVLQLRRYDAETESYCPGAFLYRGVSYIVHGPAFGIPDGYCVMSITRRLTQP